jgi:ATP-dependent protease Clp ATPase subunit
VIARRAGRKSMGFLHEEEKERDFGKALGLSGRHDIGLLEQVQPVDLLKFGLIPEDGYVLDSGRSYS